MATCSAETLLASAAASGFPSLAERNKIDVLLQLFCDISAGGFASAIEIGVALSDQQISLTTGTAKEQLLIPVDFTLTGVIANVSTAPTDADIIVNIKKNGSTIFSTLLHIDDGDTSSLTSAAPAVISDSTMTLGDSITFDVDQIGTMEAGKGLKVWMLGTRA